MHDWKIGDRFSVEGVITAGPDCNGDYRATVEGRTTDGCVAADVMKRAKIIEPAAPQTQKAPIKPGQKWKTRKGTEVVVEDNPNYDDNDDPYYSGYPFQYKSPKGDIITITSEGFYTDGPIIPSRHDLITLVQDVNEPQKLDTSKPMRRKGAENEMLRYLHENPLGQIYCRDVAGYVMWAFPDDLENIPEQTVNSQRQAVLLPDWSVQWYDELPLTRIKEIIGIKTVEIKNGDGMDSEEGD